MTDINQHMTSDAQAELVLWAVGNDPLVTETISKSEGLDKAEVYECDGIYGVRLIGPKRHFNYMTCTSYLTDRNAAARVVEAVIDGRPDYSVKLAHELISILGDGVPAGGGWAHDWYSIAIAPAYAILLAAMRATEADND